MEFLPLEVIRRIVHGWYDAEILILSRVCRQWRDLILNREFWHQLLYNSMYHPPRTNLAELRWFYRRSINQPSTAIGWLVGNQVIIRNIGPIVAPPMFWQNIIYTITTTEVVLYFRETNQIQRAPRPSNDSATLRVLNDTVYYVVSPEIMFIIHEHSSLAHLMAKSHLEFAQDNLREYENTAEAPAYRHIVTKSQQFLANLPPVAPSIIPTYFPLDGISEIIFRGNHQGETCFVIKFRDDIPIEFQILDSIVQREIIEINRANVVIALTTAGQLFFITRTSKFYIYQSGKRVRLESQRRVTNYFVYQLDYDNITSFSYLSGIIGIYIGGAKFERIGLTSSASINIGKRGGHRQILAIRNEIWTVHPYNGIIQSENHDIPIDSKYQIDTMTFSNGEILLLLSK